jgi:hypothetical protein
MEMLSDREYKGSTHSGEINNNSGFITVECLIAFDTDEDKTKVLSLVTQTVQNCTYLAQSSLDQVRRD